jgi:hypothetical protein
VAGNSNRVPSFLKATSPQGLVRLMLSNNVKLGMQFEYQIVHDGKSWFAWFYILQDKKEALSDALQSGSSR